MPKDQLPSINNDDLDYDQSYLRNKRLPRPDAQFNWTPEMIAEIKKCKDDIHYFAEKYFHIVTLDEGKQKISLYPAQRRVLKSLQKYRFNIINASRQSGKALALNTPIPTLNGWKTMGSLKEGEQIFGSDGAPCTVLKTHDIMDDRPCYRITFDNKEEIIADEDHLWFTQSRKERRQGLKGSVKTTNQLLNTIICSNQEPNHRIPSVLDGVQYTEKSLPIDPYILGLWLGDGSSEGAQITVGKRDVHEIVEFLKTRNQFDQIIVTEYKNNVFGVRPTTADNKKITSLNTLLKQHNLVFNKHIPDEYMISHRNQRLDLLKGLLDSDGYIDQKGNAHFYNTNIELTIQVKQLIESLGYKTSYRKYTPTLNGFDCSVCGEVIFKPREIVCTLSFKTKRIRQSNGNNSKYRNRWHYIKKIEKLDQSVPVRCITVDSKDSLYLCGKTFIPTHNTTLTTIYALWMTCFDEFKRVVIVANKENTAIMILRRVALAYEELPNWLKPGTAQYGKKEIIFANHSSIGISTTTGSAVRGESVNCIIIDEAAHIEPHLMDEFWASVIPVISSSKKRTTKIFMVSTPKGTGNLFYEIYTKAEKGEHDNEVLTWHAESIHWYEVPGRGKLWKADMVEALHNDKLLFEQEFNCCFLETGDSAIDIDLLNELELACRPPEQTFEDGYYQVWRVPQPNHIYGIGVDVGEGIGKAASVVQVLDFTDLTNIHQVAVYANRYIHPTRFADVINRICHHYNCPPVLIERNNIGSEVLAVLKEVHSYENIVSYNTDQLSYGDIRTGILSSTNTKFTGVMNMRYWLNTCKTTNLYDIGTVQELKTFVRYPNGTWKKKQGDNVYDDRVMALVWGLFLLNDDVASRYYDIIETDDHGKPLKIAAYNIQQPSMFKLDPFFQNTPNAPMPSFFTMKPDSDYDDLKREGWDKLKST